MKAIESFSVSESFGLKDLSLEEIETINGGESVSIGHCSNVATYLGPDGVNIPTPGGSPAPSNPIPIGYCVDSYTPVTPICGGGTATPICGGGPSSGSSSCGGGVKIK